jgi:cyclohexadienyl dehydratase
VSPLARGLAALLLVGCAHAGPELRVGTSGDYAPFSLDGRGFDVEVAHRFAAEHGLALRFVPFRWPELEAAVRAGTFDVAMSGVTWRPERAVVGYQTRAVAMGAPCLVGADPPRRVAVNRGGRLERWARARFPEAAILAVDDNRSLPERLCRGEVDAFVTDRFELGHVRDAGWPARCEPATERKVYWVAPARAADLGPALDAWLERSEPALAELRARWFGAPDPRAPLDDAIDLLARRFELMPAVARAKRARGLPLADPAQEERVLAAARQSAASAGLAAAPTEALFRLLVAQARRVQQRAGDDAAPALDLDAELRPAIGALGPRIVAALARAVPLAPGDLPVERMLPLATLLDAAERAELARALGALQPDAGAEERWLATTAFRMPSLHGGRERYSAWFADADARTLYFGLSPFWELWWRDGDPRAELREPGDHLIGRFDLASERFLPPLRVRAAGPTVRGSVWDVLVHPNGRVYYTTFFEEMGSVRADGTGVEHYARLGAGLNEIALAPGGELAVTRYAGDAGRAAAGGVAIVTPDGSLAREIELAPLDDRVPAAKSIAIDPTSGELWLNTDSLAADGSVAFETVHLAADGRVLARSGGPPELQFPHFDAAGTGWLARATGGRLELRVLAPGAPPRSLALGPIGQGDFVQEVRSTPAGGVVLALWSGRVVAVEPDRNAFRCARLRLRLPPDCVAPAGRSALYTAVVHGERLYATLFCGATVLRAEWQPPRDRCHEQPGGAESEQERTNGRGDDGASLRTPRAAHPRGARHAPGRERRGGGGRDGPLAGGRGADRRAGSAGRHLQRARPAAPRGRAGTRRGQHSAARGDDAGAGHGVARGGSPRGGAEDAARRLSPPADRRGRRGDRHAVDARPAVQRDRGALGGDRRPEALHRRLVLRASAHLTAGRPAANLVSGGRPAMREANASGAPRAMRAARRSRA